MAGLRRSNRLWLVVCILGLGAAVEAAVPRVPFRDDFNDNVRGVLWDEEEEAPSRAWVVEKNQRLEFKSTADSADDLAHYVSRNWYLDTAHDFALEVDWHFSHLGGQASWVELRVSKAAGNYMDIQAGAEGSYRYAKVTGKTRGVEKDEGEATRHVNDGTFYISYDSSSDKLYLSMNGYWIDQHAPSNGNWVRQGKVRGQWKAKALSVLLGGGAEGAELAKGQAYLDDFWVREGSPVGPPSAPDNVVASDGTQTDRVQVTWGSVGTATAYRVYRAGQSWATKTAVSDWIGRTKYGDTTATPGKTYHYWLKAKNAYGRSDFSDSDTGWMPLNAPENVKASDGTYTGKVRVTWDAVTGASEYRVFRAGKADGTKSAISNWQSSTAYGDTTAKPGKTYHYWVKARNVHRKSSYSTRDTGWRAMAAPDNVQASDDTYADKVRVTWDAVSGATKYRVFRAGSAGGTKKAISDWQSGTTYDDKGGQAGKTYYYWAKAKNTNTSSGYSAYDTGSRTG